VKLKRIAAAALFFAGSVGALALLLESCSTAPGTVIIPSEIAGAHYVGNRACADCHADYVRRFPASPHARTHFQKTAAGDQAGCESCHGPGSKHVEDPAHKFIINPGKDPSACFQCHVEIQAEFHLPQHHPVIEGKMNCIQCHDPHGMDIMKPAGGLALARVNQNCAACHRDQTRPFAFGHEAMREGCTTCHNPHGSINRKMLVQSDPNLCLRCHAQAQGASGEIFIGSVSHTAFLRIGTCWTSGCHSAVHGSNVDPRFRF
jgi:predicted CXXCH cytochrome family protein